MTSQDRHWKCHIPARQKCLLVTDEIVGSVDVSIGCRFGAVLTNILASVACRDFWQPRAKSARSDCSTDLEQIVLSCAG